MGATAPGSGIGTGLYTIGKCVLATNTVCSLSGSYLERADSTHTPGATGTFLFQMSFGGVLGTPVIARSQTPGNDALQFLSIGDALFTLFVTPAIGDPFTSVYPATPFANSLAFSGFASNAHCTGTAVSQCTPGAVGLVNGAIMTANVAPFVFSIPDVVVPPPPVTSVPEPTTAALLLAGLLGAGLARRRPRAVGQA